MDGSGNRAAQYVRDAHTGRWVRPWEQSAAGPEHDAGTSEHENKTPTTSAQREDFERQRKKEQARYEVKQRQGNAASIKELIAERKRQAACKAQEQSLTAPCATEAAAIRRRYVETDETRTIWRRRRQEMAHSRGQEVSAFKFMFNTDTWQLERVVNYFGKIPDAMEVLRSIDIPEKILDPRHKTYATRLLTELIRATLDARLRHTSTSVWGEILQGILSASSAEACPLLLSSLRWEVAAAVHAARTSGVTTARGVVSLTPPMRPQRLSLGVSVQVVRAMHGATPDEPQPLCGDDSDAPVCAASLGEWKGTHDPAATLLGRVVFADVFHTTPTVMLKPNLPHCDSKSRVQGPTVTPRVTAVDRFGFTCSAPPAPRSDGGMADTCTQRGCVFTWVATATVDAAGTPAPVDADVAARCRALEASLGLFTAPGCDGHPDVAEGNLLGPALLDLPEEVICHVIRMLPSPNLVLALAASCRHLYHICMQPSVWRLLLDHHFPQWVVELNGSTATLKAKFCFLHARSIGRKCLGISAGGAVAWADACGVAPSDDPCMSAALRQSARRIIRGIRMG
eukprot:m.896397 g.896397  ORF g.896397 m.896397 type:complete len:569 (-) comp23666_c0_seq36:3597-5303(-)